MELWFTEKYNDVAGLTIRVSSHLHHSKSNFQEIDVFDSQGFGRILVLDGLIMLTERDEFIYHETLVHPAMVMADRVEKVLVVGGGDGGSTREVLKYSDVEKITVVEIDREVIEVCRKFFPSLSDSFSSEKVQIINRDITDYIKNCSEKYDVIILDTSDPVGPAKSLYTEDFYRKLNNCLDKGGTISIQSESPWWQETMVKQLSSFLKKFFPHTKYYTAPVLSYPGGLWLFSLVSEREVNGNFNRELPEELKFVDADFIKNYSLPPFIRDLLA